MRLHLRIRGRVQGVGFRFFTLDTARRLGVNGWVRNLPGGEVEAEAEGNDAAVEAFVRELSEGPPFASVESVERRTLAADERRRDGFEIR